MSNIKILFYPVDLILLQTNYLFILLMQSMRSYSTLSMKTYIVSIL